MGWGQGYETVEDRERADAVEAAARQQLTSFEQLLLDRLEVIADRLAAISASTGGVVDARIMCGEAHPEFGECQREADHDGRCVSEIGRWWAP